jgi:hypothetical protein
MTAIGCFGRETNANALVAFRDASALAYIVAKKAACVLQSSHRR